MFQEKRYSQEDLRGWLGRISRIACVIDDFTQQIPKTDYPNGYVPIQGIVGIFIHREGNAQFTFGNPVPSVIYTLPPPISTIGQSFNPMAGSAQTPSSGKILETPL
jgi:hypothetical protein